MTSLLIPIHVYDVDLEWLKKHTDGRLSKLYDFERTKRSSTSDPVGFSGESPVYFDAIGQPRGIPDEFKLLDEVADGWSGAAVQAPKNAERINYVHYNVQRLANYTRDLAVAVHEQLHATSLVSHQNRLALDMILAEKGGVCAMFGTSCCTFIPNNTAPDGSLTRALEGLQSLSAELTENSGIDSWFNDLMSEWFGKWRHFALAVLSSVGVFLGMIVCCGCCCVPCTRALCVRLIDRTVSAEVPKAMQMYMSSTYSAIPGEDPDVLPLLSLGSAQVV